MRVVDYLHKQGIKVTKKLSLGIGGYRGFHFLSCLRI